MRHGPAPQPRFSFLEIERHLYGSDILYRESIAHGFQDDVVVSASYLADRLDVSRGTIHRWRREGVPCRAADRAAITLDVHPVVLWPDYYTE